MATMLYHTLQSHHGTAEYGHHALPYSPIPPQHGSNTLESCDTYLGVYEYQVEENILDVVSYLCGLPTLFPVEEPRMHPLFSDAHNTVALLVNVRMKHLHIKLSQLLYD